MFNTSNDCFTSSPTSPSGVIFNRQHQNSRYHPYSRVTPSYYPHNDLEGYSYDHNTHNTTTTLPTYDHSIMPYDYNLAWMTTSSSMDNEISLEEQTGITNNLGGTGRVKFPVVGRFFFEYRNRFYTFKGAPRCFKRRVSANKKERRRTQSINTAFSDLRTAIPNVQPDTKLSKIKTLKLATKYIEFLMDILAKDDPTAMPSAFKAEIIKTRKDHRDLMKVGSWKKKIWHSI